LRYRKRRQQHQLPTLGQWPWRNHPAGRKPCQHQQLKSPEPATPQAAADMLLLDNVLILTQQVEHRQTWYCSVTD
jgi:hypothetical protein